MRMYIGSDESKSIDIFAIINSQKASFIICDKLGYNRNGKNNLWNIEAVYVQCKLYDQNIKAIYENKMG